MMKRKIVSATVFAALVSSLIVFSCSKEDEDDDDDKEENTDTGTGTGTIAGTGGGNGSGSETASFKVQLNNSSPSLTLAATSLTAKLGGVDLIADCAGDAPPGNCLDLGRSPDPDIWVNEGCNDDIAQCTTANTEFFELIDPTEANTVLNSQGRSIDPGVFTKVRIYFLNNDEGDALECDGATSAVRPAIPITVDLPSAITVAAGDSVTVTLNYDPSTVDCSDDTSISTAISEMTATVTKN